jgi:hypothetical protein
MEKFIQEKKGRKVIGWATLIDQKKLESLRSDWRDLFNLKKYTLKERFSVLNTLGVIQKQERFDNITPTVGFEALAKALTGNISTVAEIKVNVHAMGTGTTPAADGDTTLETEGIRKSLASWSYNDNKSYYTAFYGLSEAVGTWTELGLYIDADPLVTDDGVLWDRTLTTITKTSAQSLTIDVEDTFANL